MSRKRVKQIKSIMQKFQKYGPVSQNKSHIGRIQVWPGNAIAIGTINDMRRHAKRKPKKDIIFSER